MYYVLIRYNLTQLTSRANKFVTWKLLLSAVFHKDCCLSESCALQCTYLCKLVYYWHKLGINTEVPFSISHTEVVTSHSGHGKHLLQPSRTRTVYWLLLQYSFIQKKVEFF
jgi:hypothetical protein